MNIPEIIRSSTSPEKVSLFVKSIAIFAVLFGFDQAVVDEAGGYIGNLIVLLGQVATIVTALWGLIRKMTLGRWSA